MPEKLIKSKQRVKDFAEVFTPKHIVKNMCDLVPEEMWVSVDTTFLEIILPSLIQEAGKIKKCALAV